MTRRRLLQAAFNVGIGLTPSACATMDKRPVQSLQEHSVAIHASGTLVDTTDQATGTMRQAALAVANDSSLSTHAATDAALATTSTTSQVTSVTRAQAEHPGVGSGSGTSTETLKTAIAPHLSTPTTPKIFGSTAVFNPTQIVVDSTSHRVYVVSHRGIQAIDGTTMRAMGLFWNAPVGDSIDDLGIDQKRGRIYALTGGGVQVIDSNNGSVLHVMKMTAQHIDVDPQLNRIYAI